MSYTSISDFRFGMDRRRPQVSGVPGTLYTLKNAVITRGGDIERAKKFAEVYALPAGTFGLFSVQLNKFVFGSSAAPAGMPVGVRYQQLAAPNAPSMTDVLDAKGFSGKNYVIAAYDDGNIYHFYDGARVTEWDSLADEAASFETVAQRLADLIDAQTSYGAQAYGDTVEITAAAVGTPFTISTSTTDGPVQSPASGTVEITGGDSSPGTNTVSQITVDGNDLLGSAVDWDTDNETTASNVAAEITSTATAGYSATVDGAVVTILAPSGTGAEMNGEAVSVTVGGDVTATSTALTGGVGQVSSPTAVATEQQANVTAVAETKATGTVEVTGGSTSVGVNKIRSVTVNGVELLAASVDWISSNSGTANALAVAINDNSYSSGYSASAAGSVVTISAAPGTGAAPNGYNITSTTAGNVTTVDTDMAGGVAAVTAVAEVYTVYIGGSVFDSTDLWSITLDGVAYKTTGRASATGTSAYVSSSRVFSTAGSLLRYCKINDPTDWTDATQSSGAGFINIANEVEGAATLVGVSRYDQYSAIFARNAIVIYDLQADMQNTQIVQPIDNTGTLAARSIVPYGANDVYYLDETGIRSLRQRSVVNSAYASDVGSAIDSFIHSLIVEAGAGVTSKASAAIEAVDGRYMLAIGQYVVVLSQFPSSKIVAWSYIDFGEQIDNLVRVNRTIYLRAGDKIYAYGGATGDVYPDEGEFDILAETPFISSKDPAGIKQLQGFDMAAEGVWRVQILPDPNNEAHYTDVGYIKGTTYNLPAEKFPGYSSHFALRMTCEGAGYATLSSTAVHEHVVEKQ